MNKFDDERIQIQKLKIINGAYLIIMGILMISMLVKLFVLQAQFSDYMTEFIAFFAGSFYVLIRIVLSGHMIYQGRKKLTFIVVPLVSSTAVTLLSFLGNMEHHVAIHDAPLTIVTLVITFLSSFIITFMILFAVDKLGKKRAKRLEDKFDA